MKRLTTTQKLVLAIGILGTLFCFYGGFTGWDYMDYFPVLYSSVSLIWVAFMPTNKKCCKIFKGKRPQKS